MKLKWTIFYIFVCMAFLQGCETFKGAKEGFKKDVQQMKDGNSGLHKVDAWMQEHMW